MISYKMVKIKIHLYKEKSAKVKFLCVKVKIVTLIIYQFFRQGLENQEIFMLIKYRTPDILPLMKIKIF